MRRLIQKNQKKKLKKPEQNKLTSLKELRTKSKPSKKRGSRRKNSVKNSSSQTTISECRIVWTVSYLR